MKKVVIGILLALGTTLIQAQNDISVGVQYSHTVFGLSVKKEVAPKVLIQGTFGLTNSDDISVYGIRGIYKLTETKDYYTYGFASLSMWKYKALQINGSFSSEFKDESSIGFGLGVGMEYSMKSYTNMPLYWSVELGYDKVGVDTVKGSVHGVNLDTSVDIGGTFIGTGFHYKF